MATAEPFGVGRLVITVQDAIREPGPPEQDRLVVTALVENPLRPLGEDDRPPLVEAQDAEGRTYPLVPDGAWLEPVRPDTTVFSRLEFEVARDASGIELVFDPASDNPMRVELDEA